MKYCCIKFEEGTRRSNLSAPNIRIVKYLPTMNSQKEIQIGETVIKFREKLLKSDYRFYITLGYETFNPDSPNYFIEYCPFCGADLFETYNAPEFANETEGKTFGLKG